jgi:hypothetical protein
MSKFDFNKLREQVLNTQEHLKKNFKGTDAQIEAVSNWLNNEEIQKKRIASLKSPKTSLRLTQGQKQRYQRKEERIKTSESMKQVYKTNPNRLKDATEKIKQTWAKEEVRKKASKSHKQQWLDADKRKNLSNTMKSIRKYPIMTPNGRFESTQDAAEFYGISKDMIGYYRKKYPDQYYYCDRIPHSNKKKK